MALHSHFRKKQQTLKGVAVHSPESTGQRMTMRFRCQAAGAPGTGVWPHRLATVSIKAYVQKHGIATMPFRRMVELANGSHTHARLRRSATPRCCLLARHSAIYHIRKLHWLVVELGDNHGIILGQNWMLREGVVISFPDQTRSRNFTRCLIASETHPRPRPLVRTLSQ
jgi:hypothetical protein